MLGRQSVGCLVILSGFFHWRCLELWFVAREQHTAVGVKTNQVCQAGPGVGPDRIQQLNPS